MQSVKYFIIAAACSTVTALQAAPTTDLPPAPQAQQAAKQPVAAHKAPQVAQQTAAAPQPIALQQAPASQPSQEKSADTLMQEHIQRLVEQDYEYQAELRKLNNQVEVEKKRNEIRKLRGEDKLKAPQSAPVVQSKPEPAVAAKQDKPAAPSVPPPHVVLESVVGGLSRVAVVNNSGNRLLYVKPGDSFAMDGKNYLLIKDAHLGLLIKDAAQ